MLSSFFFILKEVLLPIMIMAALGAAVQKFCRLDMNTLSRLNVYLFVPTYLFVRFSSSHLTTPQIGRIVLVVMIAQCGLLIPLWFILKKVGMSKGSATVFLLASAIYNSGNFGIPLAERAFPGKGGDVQSVILMFSNLTLWVFGSLMLALATNRVKDAVLGFFKQPLIYAIVCGWLFRALNFKLPEPVSYSLATVAQGLVPMALVTLGAQLVVQARMPRWKVVFPVVFCKLIAVPLITTGAVLLLGLWPWPGAMIIVASAAPTAVNVLLISLEQGGDNELAAQSVFWTTICSAFTVTIILGLVKAFNGNPP